MENEIKITEEQIKEILKEKLPIWFANSLTQDYSNPLKDAVESAIKEQDGVIKELVNELLTDILSQDDFKVEIKKELIGKIIAKGLNS